METAKKLTPAIPADLKREFTVYSVTVKEDAKTKNVKTNAFGFKMFAYALIGLVLVSAFAVVFFSAKIFMLETTIVETENMINEQKVVVDDVNSQVITDIDYNQINDNGVFLPDKNFTVKP